MNRRPVLFGSAALVALWSGWIVVSGRVDGASASVVLPAPRPAGAAVHPVAAAPAVSASETAAVAPAASSAGARAGAGDTARVTVARLWAEPADDAFAAREWVQPPPPPPPPPPAAPPPPPPAPPPPPPPTLPYRFVGLIDEGRAAPPRAFLALGEKLIVAAAGDTLDGGYRLVAISAQELVFTHVQNNVTLKLAVAGGNP